MGLTVTEARRRLTELIQRAVAGEEIVIGRYGGDQVVLIGSAKLANLQRRLAEMQPSDARTLAEEVGQVWERAVHVLESEEHAVSWLCQPNSALQGRTPRDVAATDTEVVLRVLGRLEHGVF